MVGRWRVIDGVGLGRHLHDDPLEEGDQIHRGGGFGGETRSLDEFGRGVRWMGSKRVEMARGGDVPRLVKHSLIAL